jgi:dTDP-4-dehydrorhamnose 3,5-epimerase
MDVMKFKKTKVAGAWIIEPKVFEDERGSFCETWNSGDFSDILGIHHDFVQMNQSKSKKDVLRGLHYQIEFPQAKLVWVASGSVLDVFVDLREKSPTFCQSDSYLLTGNSLVYIPEGCAHGFYVRSEEATFNYLVSDFRYPEHEKTLMWNDPFLNIDWSGSKLPVYPILSEKDNNGLSFADCDKY